MPGMGGEQRSVRRGDVVVDVSGGVVRLTIDRSERRNALDPETVRVLTGLLERAERDRRVRCLVLTGSGRHFCTGGDLAAALDERAGEGSEEPERDPWDDGSAPADTLLDYRWPLIEYQRLFRVLWELETPAVAAVNGSVAGLGWMLALLCDFVVAAEGARWSHAFSRRGMMPHAGDTVFLPRVVPLARLNALAMLGETVTTETVAAWGLLHSVVPADAVDAEAGALAARLAEGPTLSLGQAKRLYRRALLPDVELALAEERAATALVSATNDRQEGTAAMVEGRPPRFTGT